MRTWKALLCRSAAVFALVAASSSHAYDLIFEGGFETPPDAPASDADAARFLTMATFGPTQAEITRLRGIGAGDALMRVCLYAARRLGYRTCYLETLTGMDAAQKLYVRHGFAPIPKALGNTGHFGCNRFYTLAL